MLGEQEAVNQGKKGTIKRCYCGKTIGDQKRFPNGNGGIVKIHSLIAGPVCGFILNNQLFSSLNQ